MQFRKAESKDIPRMAELRKRQLIEEGLSPEANIDKELDAYFERSIADGSFVGWLALDGGEIAATSGVCFLQAPPTYSNPSGRVAYVTNMYTLPSYRRQGLASRLLKFVTEEAASRNISLVRLHASDEAASVYRKFGFTDSDGFMRLKL